MAEAWATAVQDTCCHLTLSFPGSCSRKRLRQRIQSLPVSAGGCAGLSPVGPDPAESPAELGRRAWSQERGRGCAAPLTVAVPQPWQLEASPVLRDISQLQVRRDRERQRPTEPEDEVRGAARPGGQGGGRGVLTPCRPCCRRVLSPRSCRGWAIGAGCPPAMGLPGGTPLP